MLFRRKQKKEFRCETCDGVINKKYIFCPYCGVDLADPEEHLKEFGLLGADDLLPNPSSQNAFNITDKMIVTLVKTLAKNFEHQFRTLERAEINEMPNGVQIKIGFPQMKKRMQRQERRTEKSISNAQLEKMSSLPRAQAKTSVRRIGDKVIYELNIPGISSPEDVFVAKLESGYEVKAIGDKKVYVNSLPVNLPLQSLNINNDKLVVEFAAHEE